MLRLRVQARREAARRETLDADHWDEHGRLWGHEWATIAWMALCLHELRAEKGSMKPLAQWANIVRLWALGKTACVRSLERDVRSDSYFGGIDERRLAREDTTT